MNGTSLLLLFGLSALGLLIAGGWLLRQAPTRLDRAVASLSLDGELPPEPDLRRPREQHRAERGRRPAQRPSRPATYDW
jgi:hypothetical protein